MNTYDYFSVSYTAESARGEIKEETRRVLANSLVSAIHQVVLVEAPEFKLVKVEARELY